MPILANGAEVEIESAGSIVISKKIETTGILDSEAGDISIDADDDVTITKAIVGADIFGDADLAIDGRDVTISGNLDFRGGGETPGGRVDVTADRDLLLTGDIFVNVSGADLSDAGSIDMQAGRNLQVDSSVELIADGAPQAAGGSIFLIAGEGFGQRLPGNLTISGDIKANGHTVAGSFTILQGCVVTIPSGRRHRRDRRSAEQQPRPRPVVADDRRPAEGDGGERPRVPGRRDVEPHRQLHPGAKRGRLHERYADRRRLPAPGLHGRQRASQLPLRLPDLRRQSGHVPRDVRRRCERTLLRRQRPLRRALPADDVQQHERMRDPTLRRADRHVRRRHQAERRRVRPGRERLHRRRHLRQRRL
jgi:hypothetical protein